MQACSHATLRPLTHTTLASASALLATANAGAISTEEAYAPMAERLRSCAASHRIQTGRMRKSTRAVVTCGATVRATPEAPEAGGRTAHDVQYCPARASCPAPQVLYSQYARHGWGTLWLYVSAQAVTR